MEMNEPTAVVFGGSGYLGSHVVQSLLDGGYQVRVAVRHPDAGATARLGPRVTGVVADIRDESSVSRAIEGADAVVNCVSLYVETKNVTFYAVHVEGAEGLARCCARGGVPALVHISGINSDPASRSAYVCARGEGENRVRDVFPQAMVLRPSVMFGAQGGLMATLDSLTRLPVIPIFGRGNTRLQPAHVKDVARAVVAALAEGGHSTVFELGGAQVLRYRELVQLALRRRQRKRPLLPVPFTFWYAGAALLSFMKSPPLTRDQLVLMEADNVAHQGMPGFDSLGLTPCGVDDENS